MDDRNNDPWTPTRRPAEGETAPTTVVRPARRGSGSQKTKIAGALVVGGIAGAAIMGPLSALAASPSAAPSATSSAAPTTDPAASADPTTTADPSATSAPAATPGPSATPDPSASSGTSGSGSTGSAPAATAAPGTDNDGDHGPGGFGDHNEAISDASVVAKAIGISEADLTTALQGGQTVAQVAAAHNVDVQVVIDALVADGQSELDAAVKAGTITQAQADQEKTELTQRATDQVNGSLGGGRH